MIKTLVEIGKALRNEYPVSIVEAPYPNYSTLDIPKNKKEKFPMALVVNMKKVDGNVLQLESFDLEHYDPTNVVRKYYFRNPPAAQGPAPSLSFKLPPKKTALTQRLGILNNLKYEVQGGIDSLTTQIVEYVDLSKEEGDIARNTPILVVIKIDKRWPGEIPELTESFKENFLASLADYKNKPILRVHGRCHICGKEGIVYGGMSKILKFYTVDKYGYAPELKPSESWKQYALCEDCIFDLERGKRAVKDFLEFTFYGKRFWLLPFSTGNLKDVLEHFQNFHSKVYKEGFSENLEERILDLASKQNEALFYHFVFVQKEQQSLRIRLHIEEILPSTLSLYIETNDGVKKIFKETLSDTNIPYNTIKFTFFSSGNLRATTDKPGFDEEDFYNIVNQVFRRSPIEEGLLLFKIMSRIRKELAENHSVPLWGVLETFYSLLFLKYWGILKRKFEVVR